MADLNRESSEPRDDPGAGDAPSAGAKPGEAWGRRRAEAREQALVRRIEELERDQRNLQNELALEQWKRSSMAKRKWWRLGTALGEVRSSPRRIFRLPSRVGEIVSGDSRLPVKPRPVRPQRSSAPRLLLEADSVIALEAARDPTGVGLGASHSTPADAVVTQTPVQPRRDLTVATLVDEFSLRLFEHEFRVVQVTPENWREVVATDPSMLFVESAWRGEDDAWLGKIARQEGPSPEFTAMVTAFRAAGIPTVFWNKEDPPNYDFYIGAAQLFDVVFTVCEECIPRYHEDLGHDRVFALPFSVQPKVHNPVSVGERVGDVAFAGTYYAAKHPERAKQMEVVLDPALEFDLMIFSRVASAGRYQWPERFESSIVGSLSYDDMLAAYKLFKVFTNVNSVVDSKSMCARRIFELAASATPIVSGVSPAIDQFFGDTVTQVATAAEARSAYRALLGSEELRSRKGQHGLRTVMRSHTASLRVDRVLESIGIDGYGTPEPPQVTLVVPTNRPDQIPTILENVERQNYARLQLVIAAHGFELDPAQFSRERRSAAPHDVVVVRVDAGKSLGEVVNAGFAAADGSYIGKIDDDNYYGPEFVGDLIDAFSYTDAGIVGKWTRYTYVEGLDAMVLGFPGFEHSYVDLVAGSAMLVERSVFEAVRFASLGVGEDTRFLLDAKALGVRTYSADRYNYVYMRRRGGVGHTFVKSDVELVATGELVQFGLNLDHVTV